MRITPLALLALALTATLNSKAQTARVHEAGPLRILEPAQGTWKLLRKNFFGVVFARSEAPGLTETIAYTSTYAATGPLDAVGLMEEAKKNVAQYFGAPNLKLLGHRIEQNTDRSYPCVALSAMGEIVTPGWLEQDRYRQMRVLICQPLGKTQFGFVIGFSYSAKVALDASEEQAKQFFSGVQIAQR